MPMPPVQDSKRLVAAGVRSAGLLHTGPHTKPSLTAHGPPPLLWVGASSDLTTAAAIRALIEHGLPVNRSGLRLRDALRRSGTPAAGRGHRQWHRGHVWTNGEPSQRGVFGFKATAGRRNLDQFN
jgi:hypothetical protein